MGFVSKLRIGDETVKMYLRSMNPTLGVGELTRAVAMASRERYDEWLRPAGRLRAAPTPSADLFDADAKRHCCAKPFRLCSSGPGVEPLAAWWWLG